MNEVAKLLKLRIEILIETYFKMYGLCPYSEPRYFFTIVRLIKCKKEAFVEYKFGILRGTLYENGIISIKFGMNFRCFEQ